MDNNTNESSGITISKEGKTWIVKNVNRRDSTGNYVQGNAKLVLGDKGEAVSLLQRALTNLGFSTQGIDGSFGKKTMTAVKAFQKKHGLTVDGIAGPKTQNKLYSLVDSQSPDYIILNRRTEKWNFSLLSAVPPDSCSTVKAKNESKKPLN